MGLHTGRFEKHLFVQRHPCVDDRSETNDENKALLEADDSDDADDDDNCDGDDDDDDDDCDDPAESLRLRVTPVC